MKKRCCCALLPLLAASCTTAALAVSLSWRETKPRSTQDISDNARTLGWQVVPDPHAPELVVFLIDTSRREPTPSLHGLFTGHVAGPEWDGVVRVEQTVSSAGEVIPNGGVLRGSVWLFGDQHMVDEILQSLR
jgi:hypothetical protein